MYKTNRFHFAVRVKCAVIDHGRHHSVKRTKSDVLFSSFHALTSFVIYYCMQARQKEIYLLNNVVIVTGLS